MIIIGFPGLLPDVSFTDDMKKLDRGSKYHGFLTIANYGDFLFSFLFPNYPLPHSATVISDDCLISPILHIKQTSIKELSIESQTIPLFLNKLQNLLQCSLQSEGHTTLTSSTSKVWHCSLVKELSCLGWQSVESVSSDFREVVIGLDINGRAHQLKMTVNETNKPAFEVCLPVPIYFKSNELSKCVEEWKTEILALEDFFSVMADIDERAKVIDPQKVTYAHFHRRIVLSNRVSVHLSISPLSPNSPPRCQFIGPDSLTADLREKFSLNYEEWHSDVGMISNLEQLLDCDVMTKSTPMEDSDSDSDDMECVVCYCLHCDSELPDITCEHCNQAMHYTCLYTWLKGLTTSRQSLQTIIGSCPHCSKSISCKMS